MTAKERVKAAMEFQPVDRIPATILDGGVWVVDQEHISFADLLNQEDGGAATLVRYYDKIQSDIVWVGGGCYALLNQIAGSHAVFDEVGKAAEVSPAAEDLEGIAKLNKDTIREQLLAEPSVQAILKQAKAMRELVGESKYVGLIAGAPFSAAGMLVGVQNFMEMLFDEEEEDLQVLFDYAIELIVQYINLCVEAGVNLVGLGDPVASGDLISPDMYSEFALPLLKKALPRIKGQEKTILHICGNTAARLPELVDCDIDAFSLDSVDMDKALEIAKGHYAIMGNMSPFDVMKSKTPEEIRDICTGLCEKAGLAGGGLILMPGCDLPVGTPVENVLAMTEAAEAYRG